MNYDPMARANNFEFDSELFTEEMLSEFDTEEAAALRALEENIYDEICESENFDDWDDGDGYFDDSNEIDELLTTGATYSPIGSTPSNGCSNNHDIVSCNPYVYKAIPLQEEMLNSMVMLKNKKEGYFDYYYNFDQILSHSHYKNVNNLNYNIYE